jgi:hypothetical protein
LVGSGTAQANPDNGITIGRDELNQLLSGVSPDAVTEVVRFLIAHETWHRVQFAKYGTDILNSGKDRRRVLECQADLMAGRYVAAVATPDIENSVAQLSEVVAFAERIGTAQYSLVDHPSQDARRTAVQFGILKNIRDQLDRQPASEENRRKKNLANNLLDARDDEDDFAWSFRRCRSIVHDSPAAVANVALGDADVNFNHQAGKTDAADAYVTFRIPYKNTGNRPIRVSVEIDSSFVDRTEPANTKKRTRYAALNATFDLAPGGVYDVTATLPWYGDQQFMPTLAFPLGGGTKGERTLISADFTGPVVMAQADDDQIPQNLSKFAKDLRLALASISNYATTKFKEIRGSGAQDTGDTRMYPSTQPIPNALTTEVWVNEDGSVTVESDLYKGESFDAARLAYDRYVNALKEAWPMKTGESSQSKSSGMPDFEMAVTKLIKARVYIYHKSDSSRYSVSMTITPTTF